MFCFAKLCRLCTEHVNISADLDSVDSDNVTLFYKLTALFPDMVSVADNLPTYICTRCHLQLNDAYNFKIQCSRAHKNLCNYLVQLQNASPENTHCRKRKLHESESSDDETDRDYTNNFYNVPYNKDTEQFDEEISRKNQEISTAGSYLVEDSTSALLKEAVNLSHQNLENDFDHDGDSSVDNDKSYSPSEDGNASSSDEAVRIKQTRKSKVVSKRGKNHRKKLQKLKWNSRQERSTVNFGNYERIQRNYESVYRTNANSHLLEASCSNVPCKPLFSSAYVVEPNPYRTEDVGTITNKDCSNQNPCESREFSTTVGQTSSEF